MTSTSGGLQNRTPGLDVEAQNPRDAMKVEAQNPRDAMKVEAQNRRGAMKVEAQNRRDAVEAQNQNDTHRKEQQEQMRHLQKEAFQLANYYFVFQGVIFTSFYNTPSHLKCEYRWFPFTLSMIAGVLNLCALWSIAYKYKAILDNRDRSHMNTPGGRETITAKCDRYRRGFYIYSCILLFLGFSGITLTGCWVIPCGGVKTTP